MTSAPTLRWFHPARAVLSALLLYAFGPPALAGEEVWSASNTTVTFGHTQAELEFEDPLTGTETVGGCLVIDWRDADYACTTSPWYEDWTVSHPNTSCGGCSGQNCIDGSNSEIWMRKASQWIDTTFTRPSTEVSIHLHGDNNDGLARVWVDGVVVADVDMYSSPPDNCLIKVVDLPFTWHQVRIEDEGDSTKPGYTIDVATFGAAALDCGPCAPPAQIDLRASSDNVPASIVEWPHGNCPYVGNLGWAIGLDDPYDSCKITPNSLTLIFLSPGTLALPLGGMGCNAGQSGELMVNVLMGMFTSPEVWPGPGTPAVHPIPIPPNPNFVGKTIYSQGFFVDLTQGKVSMSWALDWTMG